MDLKELAKPFPAEDIEWRIQQAGYKNDGTIYAIALAYVSNRGIQQRLDDVCGLQWQNKYEAGPCGGMSCGISILIGGEWITRWDGAGERTTETIKSFYSDSMKRAGVQWGIGRYLYKMPVTFVKVHNNGSEKGKFVDKQTKKDVWFKWDIPKLPAWALPDTPEKPKSSPQSTNKPTENIIPDNVLKMSDDDLRKLIVELKDDYPSIIEKAAIKAKVKGMAPKDMKRESIISCIEFFNVELVK